MRVWLIVGVLVWLALILWLLVAISGDGLTQCSPSYPC